MTSDPIQHQPLATSIIEAAARIIATDGIKAATIRNIAQKANVLPPQIYKHVGNLHELLDAVAAHVWGKSHFADDESDNPINRLYIAMEDLMLFGLKNPELFLHINKPRHYSRANLTTIQFEKLESAVHLVAKAGLLQVSARQAVEFVHPFCIGMSFTCSQGASQTDIAWLVRQTVKPLLKKGARRTQGDHQNTDSTRKVPALASELRANLGKVEVLDFPERHLLSKWLELIAST